MGLQHLSGDVTGTVIVGRYVFEVGAPVGMRLTPAPPKQTTSAGAVAEALARRDAAESARTPAAELEEFADDASQATDAAEQAVRMFGRIAGGEAIDPSSIAIEINAVLRLLEHLNREGRYHDRSGWDRPPPRSSPSCSAGSNSCTHSCSSQLR